MSPRRAIVPVTLGLLIGGGLAAAVQQPAVIEAAAVVTGPVKPGAPQASPSTPTLPVGPQLRGGPDRPSWKIQRVRRWEDGSFALWVRTPRGQVVRVTGCERGFLCRQPRRR